jgi:hypothetical protein
MPTHNNYTDFKENLKREGRKERTPAPEFTPWLFLSVQDWLWRPHLLLLSWLLPVAFGLEGSGQCCAGLGLLCSHLAAGAWNSKINSLCLQLEMNWAWHVSQISSKNKMFHMSQENSSLKLKDISLEVTLNLFIFWEAKSELWVLLKSRGDSEEIFTETFTGTHCSECPIHLMVL